MTTISIFHKILVTGILLMLPVKASPSCGVKPSVEAAAKSASVVFIGTVTGITSAEKAGATYSIMDKYPKWQKRVEKVDLVTFSVKESFKGVSTETIEITTGADGFAGYRFEGGTWLKIGQTYLVYTHTRTPAGYRPQDLSEENYGKDIAKELRAIHRSFPPMLALEINEFNKNISPLEANVCGRTANVVDAAEEIDQIRRIFKPATVRLRRSGPHRSLDRG